MGRDVGSVCVEIVNNRGAKACVGVVCGLPKYDLSIGWSISGKI